ncbi:MAG TPA: serine/threonine-protein kinase, partial [Kofleriaceae bacterium]|nr:serine/threonine-protein kinase [Kofleriaceae bacterium]
MGCPAPERLAQLAGTGGDPEERARVADHAASCRSCHAALALLVEATVAAPGEPPELERVGRYVIKRRLGAGGMGVVYQASDPELGRDVAIKMLRRGAPAARLRREAQALARLDHRNVVAVHDVGEHDGQVFVAMALVDGETLRAWLRTPRTTAQILDVLARAGRGIAAAHAAGLVHRDLKPDNIFVARDGEVLVGDFGLARTSDDDDAETPAELGAAATNLTMTGTVLGTPAYMAPEQAEGLATARSDQFSFCVTAWEALFGARPFAGATFDQLIDSVRAERFAEPAAPRKLPPRLVAALRRGLRADPGARFPDLGPLLAALAPRRRTRWALGAAALAGAAIAVGALALAPSHHAPDCRAAGDAIRTVWTPERRAAVTRALHDAGATDAGADELAGRLDA